MDIFKSDISMQFGKLNYTSVERTTDELFLILAKNGRNARSSEKSCGKKKIRGGANVATTLEI
jgi:hypothetical protein